MIQGQRFLCISATDRWDGPWKGRHQLFSRLLQHNEVLFVEEPRLSVLSPLRDRTRLKRLWEWLYIRRPQPNLCLYSPILCLPLADRHPSINRLNNWLLGVNLWILLKLLRFRPTILYLCHYTHPELLSMIRVPLSVYTAHDVWETYYDDPRLKQMHSGLEEQTIRRVDVAVFTHTQNLVRKQHLNPCCYHIPHGCPSPEDEGTRQSRQNEVPPDMPQGTGLRVCYWGVIDRHSVDIELVGYLAERHPDWHFVFIGPIYKPDDRLFDGLRRRPNVSFLGKKPQHARFDYFRHCHVGLLCACMTEKEMQRSRLKVLEYIAGGLPVVSIPVEEYRGMPDFVYLAGTPAEWEEMVARAAREDSPELARQRRDYARRNSWDRRVEQLSAILGPDSPVRTAAGAAIISGDPQ